MKSETAERRFFFCHAGMRACPQIPEGQRKMTGRSPVDFAFIRLQKYPDHRAARKRDEGNPLGTSKEGQTEEMLLTYLGQIKDWKAIPEKCIFYLYFQRNPLKGNRIPLTWSDDYCRSSDYQEFGGYFFLTHPD